MALLIACVAILSSCDNDRRFKEYIYAPADGAIQYIVEDVWVSALDANVTKVVVKRNICMDPSSYSIGAAQRSIPIWKRAFNSRRSEQRFGNNLICCSRSSCALVKTCWGVVDMFLLFSALLDNQISILTPVLGDIYLLNI